MGSPSCCSRDLSTPPATPFACGSSRVDSRQSPSQICGASPPGDASIGEPYAYVGPHAQRFGAFWNQPFGAARTVAELGDVPEVLAFFREGMARAADPAEG